MTKQKTIILFFLFIVVALGLGLAQAAPAAENSHLVTGFNAFSTDGIISGLTVSIVETDQYGRLVTAHEVNLTFDQTTIQLFIMADLAFESFALADVADKTGNLTILKLDVVDFNIHQIPVFVPVLGFDHHQNIVSDDLICIFVDLWWWYPGI